MNKSPIPISERFMPKDSITNSSDHICRKWSSKILNFFKRKKPKIEPIAVGDLRIIKVFYGYVVQESGVKFIVSGRRIKATSLWRDLRSFLDLERAQSYLIDYRKAKDARNNPTVVFELKANTTNED